MSDTPREPDASLGGNAVDQGARAAEVEIQTEDDVIETLRQQLADRDAETAKERQERETAERARRDAEARARDAEARAQQADHAARQTQQVSERATAQAQLDAVTNALESQKGQMGRLKAAYASAMAEGDFTKAGDLQEQMSIVGAKIVQLETGRDALDQRIKAAPTGDSAGDDRQQQPSEADRKEAYIRTMPPKVQDWLRGPIGDRYFSDRAFQQKIAAAAAYAQNVKSISPDSDQYIEFIETEVGLRQAPAQNQQTTNGQQPARGRDPDAADGGRRMTAAPAGGSTAGSVRSNADGSTSVYLTGEEKDMARRMGVSEAEWAREKAAALKANQIGPNARR